jgi:hypothetical protein
MAGPTRRSVLGLLGWEAVRLHGQDHNGQDHGMASRKVNAPPRGKPSGIPFQARFTDVASQAGLKEIVVCGHPDHNDYIVESMGCGAAFLDYDNDGWLDIFVLSGSRFGDPPPLASNRLYKNNRDGTFTDVTRKAGLFRTGYSYGVTVGDYDNDGFEDLFITCWGQNVLYRNRGDGTFADVTKEAGLLDAQARFGSGCTFLDYDRDGKLDLFVSNYLVFDVNSVPRAGTTGSCDYFGAPVSCGPRGLPYGRHSLYRNNGDGTFTDVSEASGIGKVPGGYGLTAVAADLDNDGWPDIYVACDSTPSLYFHNNHDGTFTEQAIESGVALSDDGMEQAGMGLGVGDFRCDGNLHIIKTHFSHDTSAVYLNDGKGNFSDATIRSGLGVETRFVSWGIGVADLDNDGNPDVLWVTGGIYPEVDGKRPDAALKTPRVIFRNLGKGQFEELTGKAGPGIEAPHCSRGCAFGDFDNDGDVDVLIVNQNEPPSLLRNDVTGVHHWIKVKLTGVKSNRSAVGARVTVRYGDKVQAQELMAQSSYLSVNDSRLHFGLGPVTAADIEIRWPSGQVESLKHVAADHLVYVLEGSGITRTEKFLRHGGA